MTTAGLEDFVIVILSKNRNKSRVLKSALSGQHFEESFGLSQFHAASPHRSFNGREIRLQTTPRF
jgi:hypothetical protein